MLRKADYDVIKRMTNHERTLWSRTGSRAHDRMPPKGFQVARSHGERPVRGWRRYFTPSGQRMKAPDD